MVDFLEDVLNSSCRIKCLDACKGKAKGYIMTRIDKPSIEGEIKKLDTRKMELQKRLKSFSNFENDRFSFVCSLTFALLLD